MPRKCLFVIALVFLALTACNLSQNPEITEEIPTPADSAVSLSCSQLVEQAINTAGDACAGLDTNQACYGHISIESELASNTFTFADMGDIADLSGIRRLILSPLELTASPQTWGVAILKAQANLPNTLPGQNVTLLLFGDTELQDVTPSMNAVTLRSGIGQPSCDEEPPPALLVQSPDGVQISMNFNGAEVTLGSTLYLTATENGELTIATLEGTGIVSAFNTSRIVQPGAQVRLPLGTNDRLTVTGPPSPPEPFNRSAILTAPTQLLDRPVQVPQPIGLQTATPTIAPSGQTSNLGSACIPRADWTVNYTVQPGDTLLSIARRAAISVDELQRGNCIVDANRINVGLVLRLPTAISAQTPTPPIQRPNPTQTSTTTIIPPLVTEEIIPFPTTAPPVCGDQICELSRGENLATCRLDCASITFEPAPVCGDQICDPSESYDTCPRDCPG
jgi:LysM repeat protein